MTLQGWLGDTVNLFVAYPKGSVISSFTGLTQAILAVGPFLIAHVVNAVIVLILGILVVMLTFKWTKSRGARVASVLGLLAIISAFVGGVMFVLSGFQNNESSAQMGGSFIGAYALYFTVLYYTKD